MPPVTDVNEKLPSDDTMILLLPSPTAFSPFRAAWALVLRLHLRNRICDCVTNRCSQVRASNHKTHYTTNTQEQLIWLLFLHFNSDYQVTMHNHDQCEHQCSITMHTQK